MNKHTARRKRHRANSKLRHKGAVRKHRRKAGRTGSVNAKRTPSSKRHVYRSHRPNPPGPIHLNLG